MYRVETGFMEQGRVIDSFGEVLLSGRGTDNPAEPES